jgi:hypothetical protein
MNIDKKQYVQITVNGKTGTRNIPLVNAVPYVKDWLDNHPMGNNPNAYLIPTMDPKHHPHTKGNHMLPASMNDVYTRHYKTEVFPRLLEDPKVPPEDKIKIKELLKKPFNPYIRRHSALTQKAQKLTAPVLRQHAGWSIGSKMDTKYLHLNGAESNDAILSEIYGFETAATLKAKKLSQAMAPKVCTNCNDANIPTAKFCRHCRMVLTYDAYEETLQEQQKKDDKLKELEQKLEQQSSKMEEYVKHQMLEMLDYMQQSNDTSEKRLIQSKAFANKEARFKGIKIPCPELTIEQEREAQKDKYSLLSLPPTAEVAAIIAAPIVRTEGQQEEQITSGRLAKQSV